MTEFEEDLNKRMDSKEVPMYFTQSGCSMNRKTYIETNWVFDTYKNWRSDEHVQKLVELGGSYVLANENLMKENKRLAQEIVDLKSKLEHQARVNESIEVKEKEIERLRKINHLYKKAKGNTERLAVDRGERLNQAQDELASLESQLQQQDLPVVKDFVAKWIEYVKGKDNNATALLTDLNNMPDNVNEWLFFQRNDDNINLILRAWLDGYTVEKPQFYLKNKLTDMYLYKKPLGGYGEEPTNSIKYLTDDFKFTQKEIDGMDAQGYDKKDEYKGE